MPQPRSGVIRLPTAWVGGTIQRKPRRGDIFDRTPAGERPEIMSPLRGLAVVGFDSHGLRRGLPYAAPPGLFSPMNIENELN